LVQILAGAPVFLTEAFPAFPQSVEVNSRIVPQLGPGHFLPNPFQFMSYPIIWCCVLQILSASWNNPQEKALKCH
jgi:hypothetical protein